MQRRTRWQSVGCAASTVAMLLTLSALGGGCLAILAGDDDADAEEIAQIGDATALQIDSKLRRFSACIESLEPTIQESFRRYDAGVDVGGTPRPQARPAIYGVLRGTFRGCRTLLRESPALPPPMPLLEDKAERIVTLAEEYGRVSRVIEDVTERGMDATSTTALLIFDPPLRATYEAWAFETRILALMIDGEHMVNDPRLDADLELQSDDLERAARRVVIHARPLVRCVASRPNPPVACSDEFDDALGRIDDFIAEYERDVAQSNRVFWMRSFHDDVRTFAAMLTIERRRPSDDHARDLLVAWGALLRAADTLEFDFRG